MGSDWDYINEHMGGHDEDGLPNFMSEPGFADDTYESAEEYIEDSTEEIEMERVKSYYILENLIARIEIEKSSLSHITNIELKSLIYALSKLDPETKMALSEEPDDDIPF